MSQRSSERRSSTRGEAARIRLRILVDNGDPPEPPVGLLHTIATEIHAACGLHRLKCHRLAWGWSVDQAVAAFHQMCERHGYERRGLTRRSWLEWEAGKAPNRSYQDLICRLFLTNPVRLGLASDYTPSAGTAEASSLLAAKAGTLDVPTPARAATPRTTAPAPHLGSLSSERTAVLLSTVTAGLNTPLPYTPPSEALDALGGFLRSDPKVFTLAGPPGCGKTRLTYHAAGHLIDEADFQIHSATSWTTAPDIAAEILRYARTRPGDDPIIELGTRCAGLEHPLCIVIDGIAAQDQFDPIGAGIDRVLRLVPADHIRFLLVFRAPPFISTSAYPVLAASTYRTERSRHGISCTIGQWSTMEAQAVWDGARGVADPVFRELPEPLQQLATVPLYMRLLRTAGGVLAGEINAYRLVHHCVQAILGAEGDPGVTIAGLAALACREAPDVVPSQLGDSNSGHPSPPPTARSALLRPSRAGGITFSHDVFREYFLATHIAGLVVDRGQSGTTVSAFNQLAAKASTSAPMRGVFDFVVHALDHRVPEILRFVAGAPAADSLTTLPLLMKLTGSTRFDSDAVWKACARRATDTSGLPLARALLTASRCATALGHDYVDWLLALLRTFRSDIWTDVAAAIGRTVDAIAARRLLDQIDLDDSSEATFVARHLSLLLTEQGDVGHYLDSLLGHPDWRVRAALAAGLVEEQPPRAAAERAVARLVHDGDYKVRTAVAEVLCQAEPRIVQDHLPTLLRDDNWHVRARLVNNLAATPARTGPVDVALEVLDTDDSWRICPAHVGTLRERLFLLHGIDSHDPSARQHALFRLLREARTGTIAVDDKVLDALVTEAKTSAHWLTRREAELLDGVDESNRPGPVRPARSAHETYRRLRGSRALQVALDLPELDRAIAVAEAAARAGADLIEVGDPLIKEAGLAAVHAVKRSVPRVSVVAEMMSADWGRDQVVLAAEAGADIAFLIGPASSANVAAAVDAGRRLGVPVVLDVPTQAVEEQWVTDMADLGIDGFTVTTNIDLGVAGHQPFTTAKKIRSWSRLPVSVSGGFSPTDYPMLSNPHWDIVIVGRSIAEAVDPKTAAQQVVAAMRTPEPTTRR